MTAEQTRMRVASMLIDAESSMFERLCEDIDSIQVSHRLSDDEMLALVHEHLDPATADFYAEWIEESSRE